MPRFANAPKLDYPGITEREKLGGRVERPYPAFCLQSNIFFDCKLLSFLKKGAYCRPAHGRSANPALTETYDSKLFILLTFLRFFRLCLLQYNRRYFLPAFVPKFQYFFCLGGRNFESPIVCIVPYLSESVKMV